VANTANRVPRHDLFHKDRAAHVSCDRRRDGGSAIEDVAGDLSVIDRDGLTLVAEHIVYVTKAVACGALTPPVSDVGPRARLSNSSTRRRSARDAAISSTCSITGFLPPAFVPTAVPPAGQVLPMPSCKR
jgi:hypothetical protein